MRNHIKKSKKESPNQSSRTTNANSTSTRILQEQPGSSSGTSSFSSNQHRHGASNSTVSSTQKVSYCENFLEASYKEMSQMNNFGDDWKDQKNLKCFVPKRKESDISKEKAGDTAEDRVSYLVKKLPRYLGEPVYLIEGTFISRSNRHRIQDD